MSDATEEGARPTKTMAESRLATTTLMTPELANFAGNVHGGHILRLVDQVGYACAARYSGGYCVTISVDRVLFKVPVRVGDLLTMKAQVNRVGRTSLEVGVRVEAEDLHGGPVRHTNSCFLTWVAIEDGKPCVVPQLIAETEEDRRRYEEAQLRQEQRKLADHVAASAERYRDIVELAAVAIVIVDTRDGRIRRANQAACTLLGYPRESLVGMIVWDVHPDTERDAARALWAATVSEGFAESTLVHRRADGTEQRLAVTSWQIPLASGPLIQRVMRPE